MSGGHVGHVPALILGHIRVSDEEIHFEMFSPWHLSSFVIGRTHPILDPIYLYLFLNVETGN